MQRSAARTGRTGSGVGVGFQSVSSCCWRYRSGSNDRARMNHRKESLELELSCAVCLQLYDDPVSLPCGHSYCLQCVRSVQESQQTGGRPGGRPRCPECRQDYNGLESLLKNFKLGGIVERYREAMSEQVLTAGKPTVPCDQCLDGAEPAVKTCLHCETLLCEGHLKRHQERHRSKGHTLVEPLPDLDQRRCPDHRGELEFLCLQERRFLCNECVMEGKHVEHEVQMLEAAKSDLVLVVEGLEKATSDRLQLTEALLRRAQERGMNSGVCTEVLSARATELLDNMVTLISEYKERMRNLLEEEVREYDRAWQASVGTLKEYQQQLSSTQRLANDLLLTSPSNFLFLKLYIKQEPQLRQAAGVTVPCLPIPQPADTKHLRTSLGTDTFRTDLTQLLQSLHALMNPLNLSFNPATVHSSLILSTDFLTVKHWGGGRPSFTSGDQSERFCTSTQVMCSQALSSGAHVWTVEIGTGTMWSIGVCYASIPRKGDHSRIGHNAVSWRLQWKNKKLTACHDSISTTVTETPTVPPKRLEVALDYDKGTLAFYNLAAKGRKLHLHTFRAMFREPLYPVFGLHSTTDESWITLLNAAI
ncbi:E3 ubiquitin/ISG15 ligase TRIM25-like [Astyanax mexicanus]|uniref:E3 ubiquitin/ISG15 ligase TRIM25-like n=1 Tax=Astyanax mexicanus TaxID=7994 RepID=UPI0020CB1EFA|nr:E3 ubiquitin/ISG15 ligase TRIM25-like [Astyanax mexicanus]